MDKLTKPLTILNLTGELLPELEEYFALRKISVVNPSNPQSNNWTHLLTKNVQDFAPLYEKYDLKKNGRSIVSLSRPQDLKNFTSCNGTLVLDIE